ncbi:MAG: hypothetical protein WAN48_01565 [Actinomycetes bacterium]
MVEGVPPLGELLAVERQAAVDLWVDPLSLATGVILPELDLDGHAHGGRLWRLLGRYEIRLRLLPDPADEASMLAARALLAARAWAVMREHGDPGPGMDYEIPWSLLASLVRDEAAVRSFGRQHLIVLAAREGDWLGDWVAEYVDDPSVVAALAAEVEDARAAGINEVPTIVAGDLRFDPATMPDDVHERVVRQIAIRQGSGV